MIPPLKKKKIKKQEKKNQSDQFRLEKPKKLLRPQPEPKKKIPIGPQKAQYHPRKQKKTKNKIKRNQKKQRKKQTNLTKLKESTIRNMSN